ncbi:MAG: DUF3787 domain-containing protein [Firmicutes bacterium]|nr:DUF3787 domain-containing protein [Bacillota bacterium]
MPNKKKEKKMKVPIEKHNTAAWADIEQLKEKSKVSIPSEADVLNAKEYVDSNQK